MITIRPMIGLTFAASVLLGAPGCERKPPAPSASPEGAVSEAKAAPGAREERKPAIPELPPERLPPRTRPAPDPARDQYRRDPVFVRIEEKVEKDGSVSTPAVPVLGNYLAAYFRRAGFEKAETPEAARFVLEGKFEAKYVETLTVQGKAILERYVGNTALEVRGKEVKEPLEKIDVPDFYLEAADHEKTVLDMRRRLAKIVWERLFQTGAVFADPEIVALIASLAADDSEKEAPLQAEDVVKKLASRGLSAVPYLLEALSDTRQVLVSSRYPGLTFENRDRLRIYHLADKALEEIFQKVSRLELDTPEDKRFAVIKGWENEWKKFCPSFRDLQAR